MKCFNLANLKPTRIDVIEAIVAKRSQEGQVEEIAYADLKVAVACRDSAANDEVRRVTTPAATKIAVFG
jgi:hypothetical protein